MRSLAVVRGRVERGDQGQDRLRSEARHREAAGKEPQPKGSESHTFTILEMHSSGDSGMRRGLWSPVIPIGFFRATSENKNLNSKIYTLVNKVSCKKCG